MNGQTTILSFYLYLLYGLKKVTGTGAVSRNEIRFVNEPIPGGNPLKRALWRHHAKQFNESACSVASVVSAVNAIRSEYAGRFEPIGQREILEMVRTANWKERVSRNGHNGRKGLPLPLLGKVVRDSLDAFGIPCQAIETVQAVKSSEASKEIRGKLRQRLQEFESRGNGIVLAHFDQGAFLRTLNIPHISPVGAYDSCHDRVTILDVDLCQDKPYQVSFNTFYLGLTSDYYHLFRPFGYESGGYVYIQLSA